MRIIKDIVQTHASHSDDIRAEVAYLFNRNFKTAINGLSILKMITVISPLLGLLGTVSGMLMVFDAVSAAAAQNPEVLARRYLAGTYYYCNGAYRGYSYHGYLLLSVFENAYFSD